jgi:hypothetical protein
MNGGDCRQERLCVGSVYSRVSSVSFQARRLIHYLFCRLKAHPAERGVGQVYIFRFLSETGVVGIFQ